MKETARDEDLVRESLEGDTGAFEILVRRYERAVLNAAYRIVFDAEQARDIAQSVFLKVWENLEKYDRRYKFYTWLYRITINDAINQRNKIKKHEPLEPAAHDVTAHDASPHEQLARTELNRNIQDALAQMNQDHRIVIILRHFLGCSYEDISEITHVPLTTVKSRLYTARRVIKDHFVKKGLA